MRSPKLLSRPARHARRAAAPLATCVLYGSALAFVVMVGAVPAAAQQSASFQLREHTFNAGGRPVQGTVAISASFRVSLDAIGDPAGRTDLMSSSYWMDAGFVAPYPPPGEVRELRFVDPVTLGWKPEKSTGTYDVYRGLVGALPALAYGSCFDQDLTHEAATDAGVPALGQAYFYLVTARNLLGERGTKGFASNGAERANNAPCP